MLQFLSFESRNSIIEIRFLRDLIAWPTSNLEHQVREFFTIRFAFPNGQRKIDGIGEGSGDPGSHGSINMETSDDMAGDGGRDYCLQSRWFKACQQSCPGSDDDLISAVTRNPGGYNLGPTAFIANLNQHSTTGASRNGGHTIADHSA